ncbi:MAG: hypothetical protein Q8P24_11130 [Desulfobacterales bacterium]|nr:hypothetical protein [Desulfobacterales bacterium]
MSFDKKYLVWALGYAAIGMCLGIFMAASHNHVQASTHSHVLLVGFVISLIYGVIHKLWLGEKTPGLAKIQFIVHQAGAVTIFIGLFLLYGKVVPEAQLDPILAIASITVLLGVLIMLYMVLKTNAVKT